MQPSPSTSRPSAELPLWLASYLLSRLHLVLLAFNLKKEVLHATASMSMYGFEWPSDVVITSAIRRTHTTAELDQGWICLLVANIHLSLYVSIHWIPTVNLSIIGNCCIHAEKRQKRKLVTLVVQPRELLKSGRTHSFLQACFRKLG
jgi:hypothetical protein